MKEKHAINCFFFFLLIFLFMATSKDASSRNSFEYGLLGTIILYFLRATPLLSLPVFIFNFCGLVFYNSYPEKVKLKKQLTHYPLLCIRVVTRGLYPSLVLRNVQRNMELFKKVGLSNYIIEVVTDNPINLPKNEKFREIVVPNNYETKNGSLFKARALHYCWEDNVNKLADSDWVVHLDEESLLTEDSLNGILNFAVEDKHHFGQGLITYANEEIVSWITTLADTTRVSHDLGLLRFQFSAFNKPFFGWKGSFIVAKAIAEKTVSFDNGVEGSIIEDGYFALKAFSMGYTFNFIEGEIWELSPFSVLDFIKQRKRWFHGLILTTTCKKIPLKYKLLFIIYGWGWLALPLTVCNSFTAAYYAVPFPYVLDLLISFIEAVKLYMIVYGSIRSFSTKKYGYYKIIIVIAGVILVPVYILMETVAVMWAFLSDKQQFYIVEKDTSNHLSTTEKAKKLS